MLGTSPHNSISHRVKGIRFKSFRHVTQFQGGVVLARILLVLLGIFILIMFLPWTQVVHGRGEVTGMNPTNRPQKVPSVVSGQIAQWYIQEGDRVQKGDTIVRLTEVKNQYFDPKLLSRTRSRIRAKREELTNLKEKLSNLRTQMQNQKLNRDLKLQALQNELYQNRQQIIADSMNFRAANNDLTIAENQLNRIQGLREDGLKSQTQVQEKQLNYQSALAKLSAAASKLEQSRNQRKNLRNQIDQVENNFRTKLTITRSKINTTNGEVNALQSRITKLESELARYEERAKFRHLRAPQNGRVIKIAQAGVGEMIKSGETVVRIMPDNFEKVVALYIEPKDYPLIHKGETALLQFDGWPSIVFSGWPGVSYGTFEGNIYAIDDFLSKNGKFRILVKPAKGAAEWPEPVKAGSGATGMVMLSEVPVWYELWRQLSGFPPDYYKPQKKSGQ